MSQGGERAPTVTMAGETGYIFPNYSLPCGKNHYIKLLFAIIKGQQTGYIFPDVCLSA